MIKSLRWKLLVWHSLVLLALSVAFAGLLFTNMQRSFDRDVDAQLLAAAQELVSAMSLNVDNKFDIALTDDQVELYDDDGEEASYYRIWSRSGEVVDTSHPALAIPAPSKPGRWNRQNARELAVIGPMQSVVLVGKDATHERRLLRSQVGIALAVGGIVMLLNFIGSWFLVGSALAPVSKITRAASMISASNLTTRIETARMEYELADLAGTINSAFDRLQMALEQQRQFMADASHELRTPLAVVMSNAELALRKERSQEQYRESLQTILRSSQRMKSVIEGLLSLARAEASQIQVHREPVDMARLVVQACKMLHALAAQKQVEIQQKLQPAELQGDREQLFEAILNLLENAIKYNHDGGLVAITLEAQQQKAILSIADTGPGVPQEEQAEIFDRFFRGTSGKALDAEGSGLGLAIAMDIIVAHAGELSFQSKPDGGSIFVVTLPTNQ